MASSIYGCFQVQEGIDLRNLATDDSYIRSFYDDEDLYFSEFGPRVMVVVTEKVSYWDSDVQSKIDKCLDSFINNSYVSGGSLSESWMSVYIDVAKRMNLNISDKHNFISNLSILFNVVPDFEQDVDIQWGAITASHCKRYFSSG
ncbi:unnamed protein product [Ranitomeya imitator]|uniref:Uncharacterized protein n=1 Tax=Ranitomeya imitator TaxID=111125 RepID=A0ABN9MB01_9NEOB|nr:unnamed protein product [Ranitomeya imitator]